MEDPSKLCSAALWYAAHGWPVFPLKPHNKTPATEHGLHDATTDESTVRAWWTAMPEANIGIRTGIVFDVLDIDDPAGAAALEAIGDEQCAPLPTTLTVTTGKGEHRYYAPAGLRNSTGKLAPHVDVRGIGGYVVVPPSIHPNGTEYSFADSDPSQWSELPKLPAWVLSALTATGGNAGGNGSKPPATGGAGNLIPAGQRNQTLAQEAGRLRRLGLTLDEMLAPLLRINSERFDPPLPESEVRSIAASVGRYAPAATATIASTSPQVHAVNAVPPAYSEEALALEFAERYSGKHLYVSSWLRWLRWDGTAWIHDKIGTGLYAVRELCRERAAALAAFLEQKGETTTAARNLAGWRTVSAIERLARVDPRLAAASDEFDRDTWLLNTPGGIVDLRTGAIRPHDPEARCTKITSAAPAAGAPTWTRFLTQATRGDTELAAFLQRWAGYCLTGSIQEHAMIFIHGPAAAGKSRFAEALRFALGSYAQTAPQELLLASRHDRHPAELARLQGARLVVSAETQEGRAWDEARIKALTGGDTIAARYMRADFFEFQPTLKLLVHGNHRPRLRNPDDAMRRRLLVTPFTRTVPESERDQTLPDKLEREAGGILAWMIEGALAWREDTLRPPRVVLEATETYFEAEDTLGQWFADHCTQERSAETPSRDLWESWCRWCEDTGGVQIGSQRRLAEYLTWRGAKSKLLRQGDHRGKRGFAGVRLKEL